MIFERFYSAVGWIIANLNCDPGLKARLKNKYLIVYEWG